MNPVAAAAALLAFHVGIAVASLVWTMGAVRRLRALPFLERRPDSSGDAGGVGPLVSVIIPARNEERNLRACLQGALAQRGARIQVVVVDDHSEDATLEIAREMARGDSRILALRLDELPAGWTGKTYALHRGAAASAGEWLLFIDADVSIAPDAVAAAAAFATAASVDVLSLSPFQRCEGFWERLLQPLVFDLLNARYDLRAVNDPESPAAAANGQFIMVRRPAYFEIGGHGAVRNHVVEDVALALKAKRLGFRIYFANTRSLAETRMYRDFTGIWEGWSKNLFRLVSSGRSGALGTVAGQLFLWVVPFGTLVGSPAVSGYNEPLGLLPLISGGVAVACLVGSAACLLSQIGGAPRYALLLPLGRLMLVAMIVHSWYLHISGRGVQWKGRRYRG